MMGVIPRANFRLVEVMSTKPIILGERNSQHYDAVLRISEAPCTSCEPVDMARSLADEIGNFLPFDHLYVAVFKENYKEIEYVVWGKGSLPLPDLPVEELPTWHAMTSGEIQHTADWDLEERYPRFKEWAKTMRLGSSIRIPLTTPHRRLGVFGISRDTVNPFSDEEISLLRLIGRVVAFALDDGLNLRRAQSAQACLQTQNERLQLLLNLTNRITSNLNFRELLRLIAANIREVMRCDVVAVSLVNSSAGTSRLYVVDFPEGKGFIKEEKVVTITGTAKRVLETLKPAIVKKLDPADVPPEIYDALVAEGLKQLSDSSY